MNRHIYTLAAWLATLLTPAAAVFFFGWRVYTAVLDATSLPLLAATVGLATGVGLEMVGILAGHVASEYWHRGDGRWRLAALIMAVYTLIGVRELRGTIGQVIFIIAPLVYVLVALRQTLIQAEAQSQAQTVARAAFEREQAALDREADRALKLQRQADNTAVRLERARQKAAGNERREGRQDTGDLPADWRQLSGEQRRQLAGLTSGEIREMYPVSPRTARDWRKRAGGLVGENGRG